MNKEQLDKSSWKEFEQLISEALELHNYASYWNVNLTIGGKRRQFDVVATKNNNCLLIDCKKWTGKKSRTNALQKAAKTHKERCKFYQELFKKEVTPLIVTYNDEVATNENEIDIVPVCKLNDYLLNIL